MKNLKDYKKLHYKMDFEFDQEDGIYIVKFPELPGCVAHGDTPQKALREAIAVKNDWLEVAYESNWDIPEPEKPSQSSGRITFRPPKYIHDKINSRAKQEGVSINQLLISFVAEGLEKKTSAELENILQEHNSKYDEMAQMIRSMMVEKSIIESSSWGRLLTRTGVSAVKKIHKKEKEKYPFIQGFVVQK